MRRLLTLEPGTAALICIDLQEEHRRDARYLVAGFDQILANIGQMQRTARDAGMPIRHCAYVVDLASATLQRFHPVSPDGTSAFSEKGHPLTAVCPEVAPADGEPLLVKAQASAFGDGSLADALEAHGIEWLIVAGVWTEACVDATVKDAIARGFRVLLVKDACGSGTAAMHETAILNLANRLYGGAVADTAGACRLIGGESVDVWMVEGSTPLRFDYANATDLYESL